MSAGVDWYADSTDLEQGTLLFEIPVALVKMDTETGKAGAVQRSVNSVVLTQSCDIGKKNIESLLVAEVHDYQTMYRRDDADHLRRSDYKRSLAQGTCIADFLLPPHQSGKLHWSLVNFRDLYLIPFETVKSHHAASDSPIMLATPYREHLAQAYARFMMRVGLPTNLTEFERLKVSAS